MNRTLAAFWTGALILSGCTTEPVPTDSPPDEDVDVALRRALQARVVPVRLPPPQDPAQVALGRMLFFDKILSGNRDIACATCHNLHHHATDGLSLSIGTGGTGHGPDRVLGPGRDFVARNAPTLLNRGLEKGALFWDGRLMEDGDGSFQTPLDVDLPAGLPNLLAAQAMLPVLARTEMRGDHGDLDVFGNANELAQLDDEQPDAIWSAIMERVLGVPEYNSMFSAAFPETSADQLSFQHAATAIAAFITEDLTAVDSPFDRYVGGDDDALSGPQKRGGLLFFDEVACVACHEGPLLGGTRFANAAMPQLGPGRGKGAPLDLGRSEVLDALGELPPGEFQYDFAFRVPSLRNVALTGPYMHNGAYATLEAVVRHYDDIYDALRNYDVTQLEPELRAQYHGDKRTVDWNLSQADARVRRGPLELTDTDVTDLVAFLESLSDPAASDLESLIPESVPSGLPVR